MAGPGCLWRKRGRLAFNSLLVSLMLVAKLALGGVARLVAIVCLLRVRHVQQATLRLLRLLSRRWRVALFSLRLRLCNGKTKDRSGRQIRVWHWFACDKFLQAHCASILVRLLSFQSHLLGHDSLPFGNQIAFGAKAIAKLAVPLVALEPANYAMIAAPGALWSPCGRRADAKRR